MINWEIGKLWKKSKIRIKSKELNFPLCVEDVWIINNVINFFFKLILGI